MHMHRKLITVFILIGLFFSQAAPASEIRFSPRPNKAHLIKWRGWDAQAFKEAKKTKKLILLSLSAVWCHWCHVMDETTYSDPDVISYINEHFIPIRVDSDMRPDIDGLYNQGGWPSTVIILPEGDVIDGGNYIPRDEMLLMLSRAVSAYKGNPQKLLESLRAKKINSTGESLRKDAGPPLEHEIAEIVRLLRSSYDEKYGGFGVSQKFPNPDAIDFLLQEYVRTGDEGIKTMITNTLNNIAENEIHDKTEAGFFRYSTRPDWSEPHYEKMLEVNAGLIRNYALSSIVLKDKTYERTASETTGYIMRNLYDKDTGGFFGSQDADEAYYKSGDRKDLKRPSVDPTIYADSNSQAIISLLSSYAAAGDAGLLSAGRNAADFMLKDLYSKKDGVYHYYSKGMRHMPGLLADNVLFGTALIELYNLTGERKYMNTAGEIAGFVAGKFYDKKNRRFRQSIIRTIRPSAPAGLEEFYGTASNYRAMIFLIRYYHFSRNKDLEPVIKGTLAHFRNIYERYPPSAPLYGTALRWHIKGPVEVVVISDQQKAGNFLERINRVYIPQKVIRVLYLEKDRDVIRKLNYPLEEAVYACAGRKCSEPFYSPDEAAQGIKKFMEGLWETERKSP